MAIKTEKNVDILRKVQWDIFMRLLPVTVSLCVLILVGIAGNIMTIIFYAKTSKRTTPVILITSLAGADLATCIMAIPIISEMTINVRYSQFVLCKLTHCLGLWAGACSCFILWIISIDRYRKICVPLGKQMTVTNVKYVVIGIVLFSLFLSVRLLVTFDTVEVNVTVINSNETALGLHCAAREEQNYKLVGLVFYAIDFILISIIWLTVVITYSKIIYTIVKRRISIMEKDSIFSQKCHRKVETGLDGNYMNGKYRIMEDQTRTSGQFSSSISNSVDQTVSDDTSLSESTAGESQVYTIAKPSEEVKYRSSNKNSRLKRSTYGFTNAKNPSEVNLTLMMFTVSMVFILCFTPYFAIRIFKRIVLSGREYDFSSGIQFALKLPYCNSVFNPIIYCIFNPKLRRFIKEGFIRCLSSQHKCTK